MSSVNTYTYSTTLDESPSFGVFPELSHCDLLSFLKVAQKLDSTFLEYTPRYERRESERGGGNALVQIIYLDKHREELQFAFKRSCTNVTLSQKEKIRKAICELVVYENYIVKAHPNIVDLTGISWSIDVETNASMPGSRIISPTLGLRPSEHGNLDEYLAATSEVSFSSRLRFCLHIGRAIETLHTLNIVHGDVKPQNVLIFAENGHMVAKMIDFDCSCFGLTESSLVLIVGTLGWLAPEFFRRNPYCTLVEAKRADIYSYGKLCAWLLYGDVLDVKDFTRRVGRTSSLDHEHFDLAGVLHQPGTLQSSSTTATDLQTFYVSNLPLLEEFFAKTFVGCPTLRFEEVYQAVALMERISYRFDSAFLFDWGDHPQLKDYLRATRRLIRSVGQMLQYYFCPGDQRRQRTMLRCLRDLKHSFSSQPLTFGQRQAIFLARKMVLLQTIPLIVWVILLLVYTFLWAAGRLRFNSPSGGLLIFLCAAVIYSYVQIILVLIMILLKKSSRVRVLPGGLEEDLRTFELGKIRKSNQILETFTKGAHVRSMPKLPEIFPLLNRLHYLVRSQISSELRERIRCRECGQLAETQVRFCEEVAFGTSRSDQATCNNLSHQVSLSVLAVRDHDEGYHVSLPDLPQEVIFSLQGDRVDQYTVDELPKAIQFIFQEIQGKFYGGHTLRSMQVLFITVGRLFSLIGRYEEAETCHRNALNLRRPSEWRTGNSLSRRLEEVPTAAMGKKVMRQKRKRIQLEEAENNLYAFSIVEACEIQGKFNDAIDVLLKIKSISVGPNGLYIERETGGERFHTHRIIDARNLMIRLFIEQGDLDRVKSIDQHLDLQDAIQSHQLWDSKVTDCFNVAEKFASARFVQRDYPEASEIQRRLLRTLLEFFPNEEDRIKDIKADLALSLSHQDETRAVEEAKDIQLKLTNEIEGSDCRGHSIRLNLAYTLAKLGKTEEAKTVINNALAQRQRFRADTTARSGSSNLLHSSLCLLGSYEAEDLIMIQNAFLATIEKACNKDLFISSMSLIFACSSNCVLPNKIGDLVRLVTDWLGAQSTPVPNIDKVMLWNYVLHLLSSHGFVYEDVVELDQAIRIAAELHQEISTLSDNPTDLIWSCRLLATVHRKKATFLYRIQGFQHDDVPFLQQTIDIYRNLVHMYLDDIGPRDHKTISAKENLGVLITYGVAVFSDVEICEGLAIYKDILDARRYYSHSWPDPILVLRIEAEMCHAQKVLSLIVGGEAVDSTTSQQRTLERTVEYFGENHPYTAIEQCRLLDLYKQQPNPGMTYELCENIHSSWRAIYGPKHPEVIRARVQMILSRYQAGAHHYEILPDLSRQRYLALQTFGSLRHPSALEYLGCYATVLYCDPMAFEEALALKREEVEGLEELFGLRHTKTITAVGELGEMLCKSGGQEYTEGIMMISQGLEYAVSFLAISHPLTRTLWEKILLEKQLRRDNYSDEITQRVRDEAKALDVNRNSKSVSDRFPIDPSIIDLCMDATMSTTLLGNTHGYAVRVGDRFVQLLCQSDKWDLREDRARQAKERMCRIIDVHSCLIPEKRNSVPNWTSIARQLHAMGGSNPDAAEPVGQSP